MCAGLSDGDAAVLPGDSQKMAGSDIEGRAKKNKEIHGADKNRRNSNTHGEAG